MVKVKKNPSGLYTEAARAIYFIGLGAFTISLLFNQPAYIKDKQWFIIGVDFVSVLISGVSLLLYLKGDLSFKQSSVIFIYTTIFNLSISIWYFYYLNIHFPENLLFNTFIFSIYLVLAGICAGRLHIYLVAFVYILAYGPLILVSDDEFLSQNMVVLPFLILAYAFAISTILFLLEKAQKKQLELNEAILEKDKKIVEEQNKWLNCQLESKQREIMAKSMFLLEHEENNQAFIKKLDTIKRKLSESDQGHLIKIIDDHRAEHFKKYWEGFETSFTEVNPKFLNHLNHVCPELTPSERRLAALIHLGLSSKEIGRIISISPQSVDVARSRLRSKLNLPAESNLRTFLLKL